MYKSVNLKIQVILSEPAFMERLDEDVSRKSRKKLFRQGSGHSAMLYRW